MEDRYCGSMAAGRGVRLASVAATALIAAIAATGTGQAAGETIGYSAPFLMAQFEVILQDQSVAAAKAAGLNVLAADQRRPGFGQADHRRPQPDRRRRQGPDRGRQ